MLSDQEPTITGDKARRISLQLQRGGEELSLLKVGDRFTLSLKPSFVDFPTEIDNLTYQLIPHTTLFEVLVVPDALESSIAKARELESVAFASHVYQLKNNPQSLLYLTNEITVQFAQEVNPQEQKQILAAYFLEKKAAVLGIPNGFTYQLTPNSRENPIKITNQLMENSQVLTAEANIIFHQESFYRPKDDKYPQQWYLNTSGGLDISPQAHINVEKAWDITRGNRSIVVAIMDDAIDITHPDFKGQGKIVAPRDLKDRDFSPLPNDTQESHGTACAGVAVAEENGSGVVGVAPKCALMPLRTTGYLDDQSIEELFQWAVNKGASVISCSWGASAVYFPLSLRQKAAINYAATQGRGGKGCVIVFAAGNANRPVNGTIYERGWQEELLKGPTEWLSGFAAHPDVITVSACTSLGKKAAYSNWGPHIDICAPSNNAPPGMWFQKSGYIATAPGIKVWLQGEGIFTTDLLGTLGYDPGNFTRDFGGTSSACPVVAGVAALVLSVNPNLSAQEVKEVLLTTADKIVDRDGDPQLGLKLGTYDRKGHSQWFGYGKVNAASAVKEAQKRLEKPTSPTIQNIQQRNNQPLIILDNHPQGTLSEIYVNKEGKIINLEIEVEIEHEFLGDIELYLHSPQREVILLQNRSLGSQTYLKKIYTPQSNPLLKKLVGGQAKGSWQLQVLDRALEDKGSVKNWQLNLGLTN